MSWFRHLFRDTPLVARDQIVDSISDPVLVLDSDRAILDMNLAAVRLAVRGAAASGEWQGASVDDLFPFLKGAAVAGAAAVPVLSIESADASYDVRVSRVRARRAAWLVLLHEVTAERRAAADRERFVRQNTELVSTVSHELRTPAAAIQGAVQLVLGSTRSTLAAEDRRLLEGTLRSCERLAGMVHDILDISTIESSHVSGGEQPLAIERLIIDALFDAGRLAAERKVRVDTSISGDLPLVRGDYDRLVQVFVTLLTKAIGTAPAGTTVTARGRRDDGSVIVEVQGAGDALPPGEFDGGALALSRALVEQHGGRLAVERTGTGGTMFVVRLPPSPDARAQAPRITPATVFPRAEEPAAPPAAARILIADDDADLRSVVGEALESQGFVVLAADDGDEANAILAREHIDLAVLDLNMPNRSGWEVIRDIRGGTRQPALPILVLTGSVDERETPDRLGADVLLTKPTDLRRLVAEVKKLLGRLRG